MIQFNLVPAVKLEYIKARRTKRLIIGASIIVGGFSILIFILLFVNVNVLQKQHMKNLTNEIKTNTKELQEKADIDKILTVQNQLNTLTSLHEKKPAASRVQEFLSQVTPQQASIADTTVNFEDQAFTINGTTDTLVNVNKFIDTLKFTKFTEADSAEQKNAFSEVVLSSFSVDKNQATYQIDFKYNPTIFDNTKKIKLVIPNITSTRSDTQKPSENLFQESNKETTQ